ncbi:HNH endonuclease [Glutamicibacter sp. NPDC087831]|uniref:HNH endonuclease n=1 Tax=Glutamicibacter sp. NPDC087831 TaxID=3363998 RepID=UPI00381EB833
MSWTTAQAKRLRPMVIAQWGMHCHLCGKSIAGLEDYSIDHVVPRAQGGSNELSNLRSSHRACNYSRQDRSIEEYQSLNTDQVNWFIGLAA